MIIRLLFIVFFSCFNILSSQNTKKDFFIGSSENFEVLGNNNSHFYFKKFNYIFKKDFNNILIDSLLFEENIPNNDIKLVFKKDDPIIVSKGGGMVWEVENDSFKRADNSYNHKMTNQSNVFVRNDTIMKFGGYGYWSSRNFFTYYSEITREWEYYPINQKSTLPPGISNVNMTFSNEYFYISGGLITDQKNPLNKIINDNVWRFSFSEKMWTDLGTAKFASSPNEQLLDLGNGRKLVKNEFNNGTVINTFIYDYQNNEISLIDGLNLSLSIDNGFVANDSLYNYRSDQLIGISTNSLLNNDLIKQGAMYVDTIALFKSLTRFTVVALILLFGVVLFLYSKNRKRPRVSQTGFRFDRVHYPLSVNELIILNLILYNKRVESKLILKSIYDAELSVAQNNRRKIEIVESLNKKVSGIMGVKNFINSKKSLKDQRVLIYYSNFRSDFVL